MKPTGIVLAIFVVILALTHLGYPAFAQSAQVSYNVSLKNADVRLSYLSEALPGQSTAIIVDAKAKHYANMLALTVSVYYSAQNDLKLVASATIWSNARLTSNSEVNKTIEVKVPQDAPRTSLVALVSETVRTTYYYVDIYQEDHVNVTYFPYFLFYPLSYEFVDNTDDAVAPLSYIKATTPEYVSLQSEYQMLQQKLNQTQAENVKLQQDIQAQQNAITEKNSMIANLDQQLAAAQGLNSILEIVSIILAALVLFLVVYLRRTMTKKIDANTPSTSSTER